MTKRKQPAGPSRQRLEKILSGFAKSRVLVVGDLMLDEFIWGDVSRISPEAPVPVVLVERESAMPGGAANVAYNISSLGGQTLVSGVIADDRAGMVLTKSLAGNKVDTRGIISDPQRPTTVKTRIVARHQQVVRVDREVSVGLAPAIFKRIIDFVRQECATLDAIIIEDYGKGVIVPALLRELVPLARKRNIIVTVDPKEAHFSCYRGVTCITPNQHEAGRAAGIKIVDAATLLAAGRKLLKQLGSDAVLITRGEHGMCLFERDGRITHIPTVAREVFDVSGAGDTVIAAFTLALASGARFQEAAYLSNYAAGVVVGKVGVVACTYDELRDCLKQPGRSGG